MPLRRNAGPIELDKGSIGFFTLRIDYSARPDWDPPPPTELRVADVRDGHIQRFAFAAPSSSLNLSDDYLISVQLPAGDYVLQGITCQSLGALVDTILVIPLRVSVRLRPDEVVYWGHFELDLGKRTSAELPQPGLVGLGEAMLGMTRLPFALQFQDHFTADVALVKEKYGVPASKEVRNAVPSARAPGPSASL